VNFAYFAVKKNGTAKNVKGNFILFTA